jgi:phosphate transport system substrate-binding protein
MQRRLIATTLLALALAGCVGPAAVTPPASSSPSAASVPPTSTAASPTAPSASAPPLMKLADLPRIDGSTANIPLISMTIQRVTGASADVADNTVKTSGTPTAWRNIVDGTADLLVVYEADKTVQAEVKASGVKLEVHPIGRDALVFFTNSSNPVTSLSTKQYKAIYTGSITNWSQVGGRDVKIIGYQRPEESGSQALLRKYVVGNAKMAKTPKDRITAEMGEIISGVADYANTGNAIGYSVYYYLANMYAVDGIKMMGVSGVMPSSATIADGTYPYTNDFYAVVRADEPAGSPARTVLTWLTSDAGRQAVKDAGYVPGKA